MSQLLSIIVPVFNESATIAAVLERLLAIDLPVAREILVVNDGSSDGTAAAIDAAACRSPLIDVVHLARNGGKGVALRTGLARARGDIVAIQDADLELDPAQLATLVGPILRGEADAVYGSRFSRGAAHVPVATRLGNAALTALTNALYGCALTDMETCYKVMRGDLARALPLTADRFDIEPEITVRLLKGGARIVEMPVVFAPRSRAAGKKIRWRDGVHAVGMLVRHRLYR
ncbi:MAG: glycosyltransferase family 2 protein [Vicinamibacterales bacterium]